MDKKHLFAVLVCLAVGLTHTAAQSASPIQNAKALYDSASFDEALTILDRLSTAQPETDVEEVQRYRALCLLALNRTAEAQAAIEVVFSRDPLYKLAEGDAPPRMRAAFTEVRRRLLPKIAEGLYDAAKLSFDRKEYAVAAAQFEDLLTLLEDADAKALPSLKEFRTLATGFHDLAAAAAPRVAAKPEPSLPPPPAPAPAAAQPASPAPGQIAPSATGQPAASEAPSAATGGFVPAVALRQQMPLWLAMKDLLPRGGKGMIRVLIDEEGNVDDARMAQPVHAVYDALLISAARTWKYQPAKMNGKPVRDVKLIEVVLKPAQ